MEKKPIKLWMVVLYGATAIIWIINCVLSFVYQANEILQILDTICAVVWCIAFVAQLMRYRKDKSS